MENKMRKLIISKLKDLGNDVSALQVDEITEGNYKIIVSLEAIDDGYNPAVNVKTVVDEVCDELGVIYSGLYLDL